MHRKNSLLGTLLSLLLFSIGALCHADARPNIIVFLMDDVGQTDIGAFGNPVIQTPNIDKLASEGMRFRQAFLTTSSCTASRASILTGLYPHNTGAPGLGDSLPANIDSLPKRLREAGYYTASIGKWHLGAPFKSQFDLVIENREPSGAIDWLPTLANRPKDKPFFFWFPSEDAHIPYDWHEPLTLHSPQEVLIHPWSHDSPYERVMLARYYFEIERADQSIGKVIDALQRSGELDNTIIIVLSDNGTMFGGAKTTLYDEGLLTPLVMRYPPRIAPHGDNNQLVSSIDLAPTLLELAGVPVPAGMQGVSLWPTIKNPQQPVRDFIYAERNKHVVPYFERAVRTKDFLYKRNYLQRRLCDPEADIIFGKKERDSGHEELYHINSDPLARHSLLQSVDHYTALAHHRALMNRIMHQTGDKPPPLLFEQCIPRPWQERIQIPPGFFR